MNLKYRNSWYLLYNKLFTSNRNWFNKYVRYNSHNSFIPETRRAHEHISTLLLLSIGSFPLPVDIRNTMTEFKFPKIHRFGLNIVNNLR
jgi:hypothetical protein